MLSRVLAAFLALLMAACSTTTPAKVRTAFFGQINGTREVQTPRELFPVVNPYQDEIDSSGWRSLASLGQNLDLSGIRFDKRAALPGEEIVLRGVPLDAGKVRALVAYGEETAFANMRLLEGGAIAMVVPSPVGLVALPADMTITVYVRGKVALPYSLHVLAPVGAQGQADRLLDAASALLDRFDPGAPIGPIRALLEGGADATESLRTILADGGADLEAIDGVLATVGAADAMQRLSDVLVRTDQNASGYRIASTGCGGPPWMAGGEVTAAELKCMMEWHDTMIESSKTEWAIFVQGVGQAAAATAPFLGPERLIGSKVGSLAQATRLLRVLRLSWWVGVLNAAIKILLEVWVGRLPAAFTHLDLALDGGGTSLDQPDVQGSWTAIAHARSAGWILDVIDAVNLGLLPLSRPYKGSASQFAAKLGQTGPALLGGRQFWQDDPVVKAALASTDLLLNSVNSFLGLTGGSASPLSNARLDVMDYSANVTDFANGVSEDPGVIAIVYPNRYRPVARGCTQIRVTTFGFPSDTFNSEAICTTENPTPTPSPTPTPMPGANLTGCWCYLPGGCWWTDEPMRYFTCNYEPPCNCPNYTP